MNEHDRRRKGESAAKEPKGKPRGIIRSVLDLLRCTVFVATYLTSLSFLLVAGKDDLTESLTFAGRVTGTLMIAMGVFLIFSLLGFIDHWRSVRGSGEKVRFRYSSLAAFSGAALIFVAGLFMLLTHLASGDLDKVIKVFVLPLLLFPVWIVHMAVASWMMHYMYWTKVTIPDLRERKGIAIGATITAAVAVVNFGYSQIYQPYAEPPVLDDIASFGEPYLNPDGNNYSIPVNLETINLGKVSLYLLGSFYVVYGVSETPSSANGEAEYDSQAANGKPLSRYTQGGRFEVIKADRYIPVNNYIRPGAHFRKTSIAEFPRRSSYDHLMVRIQMIVARQDRFIPLIEPERRSWQERSPLPPPQLSAATSYIRFRSLLVENNSLWSVVRRPQYLNVWWSIYPLIGTEYTIAPEGSEGARMDLSRLRDVSDRYGIYLHATGPLERALPQ